MRARSDYFLIVFFLQTFIFYFLEICLVVDLDSSTHLFLCVARRTFNPLTAAIYLSSYALILSWIILKRKRLGLMTPVIQPIAFMLSIMSSAHSLPWFIAFSFFPGILFPTLSNEIVSHFNSFLFVSIETRYCPKSLVEICYSVQIGIPKRNHLCRDHQESCDHLLFSNMTPINLVQLKLNWRLQIEMEHHYLYFYHRQITRIVLALSMIAILVLYLVLMNSWECGKLERDSLQHLKIPKYIALDYFLFGILYF